MRIHKRMRWILLVGVCGALATGVWLTKESRRRGSGSGAEQGDALAQELLARGLERGKSDAAAGVDLIFSVYDPPSAWMMLSMTAPADPGIKQLQRALEPLPPHRQDLYMRVFADGYTLAYEKAKGIMGKPARKAAFLDDRENLRTIGIELRTDIQLSNGLIPGTRDLVDYTAIPASSDWRSTKAKPYHWNPHLAGRRYASFRNPKSQVAVYEDPPAADGKRWVLLLDLKTVKRAGPAEWTTLKKASGIR